MAASLIYWITLAVSVSSSVYGVLFNNYLSHTYTLSDEHHTAVFRRSNYARSLFYCLVNYSDIEYGSIIFDARRSLCLHSDCNVEQYNEENGTNTVRQLIVVPDNAGIMY